MNYLKKFLKDLTADSRYYAEIIDDMAEIYAVDDGIPSVLLELKDNMYHVNIRCDIPPRLSAQIMYDMTMLDEDIIIGPDFFVSQEKGVLYGQEATALFYATIYTTMENAQLEQEIGPEDAIYIVQEPIYGYGGGKNKNDHKSKMQRLWGTDLE